MHYAKSIFAMSVAFALSSHASLALAQEEQPELAESNAPIVTEDVPEAPIAVTEVAVEPEASATQARLELAQQVGYGWSAGSYAFGMTNVGVVLSEHVVWTTGAGFGLTSWNMQETESKYMLWRAATDLKLYTRAPRAGGFSPTFRVGVMYSGARQSHEISTYGEGRQTSHALGGHATAGVTYFATETLGFAFETGLAVSATVARDESSTSTTSLYRVADEVSVGSTVGLSIILRL